MKARIATDRQYARPITRLEARLKQALSQFLVDVEQDDACRCAVSKAAVDRQGVGE